MRKVVLCALGLCLIGAGRPGNQPSDPSINPDLNVVLRVCNGSCPPQLTGSRGETLTFTRASASTCPNDDGSVQVLGSGVPCMPKASSGASNGYGVRLRPATTNLLQFYNALATAPWGTGANVVSAPTVTNNTTDVTDPNGGNTATKIVYPQVIGAGAVSTVRQSFTATAAAWSAQTNLRTLSGTATVYLAFQLGTGGSWKTSTCSVTAAWKPVGSICNIANQTLTAAAWFAQIGVDLGDGAESTQPAQTIYAWGGQAEANAFASDVCPTAGAIGACPGESLVPAASLTRTGSSLSYSLDFTPINNSNNLSNIFLLDWRDVSGAGPVLYSNSTQQQLSVFSSNAPTDCTSPSLTWTAGVKHHLKATWNNGVNQLLVDGVVRANCSSMPVLSTATRALSNFFLVPSSSSGFVASNVCLGSIGVTECQ